MSGYGGRGGGRGTGDYDSYGYGDEYRGPDGGQGQQGWQQPGQSSWDGQGTGPAQRGGGYDDRGGQGYDQRGGQARYPRTGGQPAQRGGSGPQPAKHGSGAGQRPAQRGSGPRAGDPRGMTPRRAAGGYEDQYQPGGYQQSGGYGQGDQGGQGGYGDDWGNDGDESFLPGFGRRDYDDRYDAGYRDRRDPRDQRDLRDQRGRDPRAGGPRDTRGPAGPRTDGRDRPRDPRDRGPRAGRGREDWNDRDWDRGPRRRATRWIPRIMLLSILVVILAGGLTGGLYVYHKYEARYHPPDYVGAGSGDVTVQVMNGDNAFSLAPRLVALGVIASDRAFTNAAEAAPSGAPSLEAGYYVLHHHMQASLAYAALLNPKNRVQTTVTIPEGKRASQILLILAKYTKLPLKDFEQVIAHPAQLGLPSYANGKVEGYLFPATYAIEPHETALQILQAMVQRFNVEAEHINIEAAARSVGLTPMQLITEASLVQAEGGRTSDFPSIAEVIYNRLHHVPEMALKFDSTVFYGLGKYGTNATFAEINTPGPYNTYLNTGLPPGPIGNPGDAAIQAVLHRAHGDLLFFVGCKNGRTLFAPTQSALGTC